MNVGFDRIAPVPQHPAGSTPAQLSGRKWTSQAQVVTSFKTGLRASLRIAQAGRCCFCRRLFYDDYAVHLEHFVDQGRHEAYRFEIRNLALSCGTCNVKKNGYFKTWAYRYMRLTKSPAALQVPTLNIQLNAGDPFPTNVAHFRWVNPYVHSYSDHIVLAHGWVFTGMTPEGRRTVRGLRLNDLAEIEQRALRERLQMRGGLLSTLTAAIGECSQHRAREVAKAVAVVIARRRIAARFVG